MIERVYVPPTALIVEKLEEEVIEQSRRLAMSFGLGTIVRFAGSYDSEDGAIYTVTSCNPWYSLDRQV